MLRAAMFSASYLSLTLRIVILNEVKNLRCRLKRDSLLRSETARIPALSHVLSHILSHVLSEGEGAGEG